MTDDRMDDKSEELKIDASVQRVIESPEHPLHIAEKMTEQHEGDEPEFHDISGITHLAKFWDEPDWVLRDMHPNLIKARSEILDKIIEDAQNLEAYRESLILDNRELQTEIETLKRATEAWYILVLSAPALKWFTG